MALHIKKPYDWGNKHSLTRHLSGYLGYLGVLDHGHLCLDNVESLDVDLEPCYALDARFWL